MAFTLGDWSVRIAFIYNSWIHTIIIKTKTALCFQIPAVSDFSLWQQPEQVVNLLYTLFWEVDENAVRDSECVDHSKYACRTSKKR